MQSAQEVNVEQLQQERDFWKEIEALKQERDFWKEAALHSQQKAYEYLDELEERELDLASLPHHIARY